MNRFLLQQVVFNQEDGKTVGDHGEEEEFVVLSGVEVLDVEIQLGQIPWIEVLEKSVFVPTVVHGSTRFVSALIKRNKFLLHRQKQKKTKR